MWQETSTWLGRGENLFLLVVRVTAGRLSLWAKTPNIEQSRR